MDSLTHALTGALIADALPFTKRLGHKAPLIAAIAGAAPDLDMAPALLAKFPWQSFSFTGLFDMGLVMRFHRAYTHSFFYMALAAIPLGFLAWRWSGKKGNWLHWLVMLALAFFSHTILDLTNPWGVRAWLPFTAERESWDLLPLMDPFIVAVGVGVFLLNHALRDSYPDPDLAVRRRYAWREKTAAFLNKRIGATAVGIIGVLLVAGRIVQAYLSGAHWMV